MKKKILAAIIMTAVPALFCACADSGSARNVGAEVNAMQREEEGGSIENENAAAVAPDREGRDNMAADTGNKPVINLTENNNNGVCIDYAIKDYASLQEFCYALFAENTDEENPVLSPVSAYLALSMAGMGADGNTYEEFREVLGADMEVFADNMMNTLPADTQDMTLAIANSAWIDSQFAVNDDWLGRVKSFLDAEAFQSDISSTETMNNINNWVEKNTNGLIPEMLEEPLDTAACLALFNTVYFKAKWSTPFASYETHAESFKLADGSIIETDMMNLYEKKLQYIANDFSEGIVLPYMDSNLSFVALKPTGQDTARELYGMLTIEVIHELNANTKTTTVNLKIPKFEITFDRILNDSLQQMGLQDAFDGTAANFDRLGQADNNIYIDLVRQKAKIIVDEEGTEAAAATEVAIRAMGLILPEEEPKNVYFDEPFLYIIMDMEKEIPLFIGIIDNPTVK